MHSSIYFAEGRDLVDMFEFFIEQRTIEQVFPWLKSYFLLKGHYEPTVQLVRVNHILIQLYRFFKTECSLIAGHLDRPNKFQSGHLLFLTIQKSEIAYNSLQYKLHAIQLPVVEK